MTITDSMTKPGNSPNGVSRRADRRPPTLPTDRREEKVRGGRGGRIMITITMAAMAMTIAYPSLPRGDCQSLSRGLGPDRPPPTATVPNSDQSLGPPAFWPNPWQSEPTITSCRMSRKLPIRRPMDLHTRSPLRRMTPPRGKLEKEVWQRRNQ